MPEGVGEGMMIWLVATAAGAVLADISAVVTVGISVGVTVVLLVALATLIYAFGITFIE